jgi:hypothetical protein
VVKQITVDDWQETVLVELAMDDRDDSMQAWAHEQELEHQYFEEAKGELCKKNIQDSELPKDIPNKVKKNVTHVMRKRFFR